VDVYLVGLEQKATLAPVLDRDRYALPESPKRTSISFETGLKNDEDHQERANGSEEQTETG